MDKLTSSRCGRAEVVPLPSSDVSRCVHKATQKPGDGLCGNFSKAQTLYGFSSGLAGSDDAGSLSSPRATRACGLTVTDAGTGAAYTKANLFAV